MRQEIEPFLLESIGGVTLSGDTAGAGPRTALLMHGLTAHRRLVLMGSRLLEREGWRVISYDARGHGKSSPSADPADYEYASLVEDAVQVLADQAERPVVVVGASMGAHTAASLALHRPDLVAGLVLITPAFDPERPLTLSQESRWLRIADALEAGGADAFAEITVEQMPDSPWRDVAAKAALQRMAAHQHPRAVAAAVRIVPFSRPFERLADLAAIDVPTSVIGSRDEADPGHPLEVAKRWAETIPGASLELEPAGESPLAWRGARISSVVAALPARTG